MAAIVIYKKYEQTTIVDAYLSRFVAQELCLSLGVLFSTYLFTTFSNFPI